MSGALDPTLEMAALTDPGRLRPGNEDAVHADAELGLAIVADGMGGCQAGEVASAMATALLAAKLGGALAARAPRAADAIAGPQFAVRCLLEQVAATNAAILEAARANPEYEGMGTTLVAALFRDSRLVIAHVGDSRAYRLRGDELAPLTRDHSLVQEMLDAGKITPEKAHASPVRSVLTRALGVDPEVMIEIHEHRVQAGDVYLLCTDGLHGMVDDAEIRRILLEHSAHPRRAARRLVRAANDHGGNDNVSAVVVRALRPSAAVADSRNGHDFESAAPGNESHAHFLHPRPRAEKSVGRASARLSRRRPLARGEKSVGRASARLSRRPQRIFQGAR